MTENQAATNGQRARTKAPSHAEGKEAPPFLTILLANDGSQHSQAAVELLCDLPLPPGTQVHALTVIPTRDL